MLGRLFSSVLPVARISPSTWDPASLLPTGSFKSTSTLRHRITRASPISFLAEGAWSHGTVVFTVVPHQEGGPAGAAGTGLPSYEAATGSVAAHRGENRTAAEEKAMGGQLGDGEQFLEVTVEARYNDQELFEESSVVLRPSGNGVEVFVKTPNFTSASRTMSQLSYHITFTFPSQLASLPLLRTNGSQWRTLGRASLASLYFDVVSITTANTLIEFEHLVASDVDLTTANSPVSGRYQLASLELKTSNGAISGVYGIEGRANIRTNNKSISGEFRAQQLELFTVNGSIKPSLAEGRDKLRAETTNGTVEGTFVSNGEAYVKTGNSRLEGKFKVGKELILKTSNGPVKATIEVVTASGDPTTPPLLAEDVKKSGGSGNVGTGRFKLQVSSANQAVEATITSAPRGVELDIEAKTSNASVDVRLPEPFDGSFQLSTSNGNARFNHPSSHLVTYETENSHKLVGRIASRVDGSASGRVVAATSNASVRVEVV